jgi:iron complex outermembrane recepter protein
MTGNGWGRAIGALVVGLLLAASPAHAQTVGQPRQAGAVGADAGLATIVGTVRSADGRPLPEAQVHLAALGRSAVTDGGGRFRLDRVPPGRHTLHFSLLGYAPVRRQLRVPAGAVAEMGIELAATPLTLPGIQVTGRTGGDDPLSAVQSATQLSGRSLERELGGTVAGTLGRQAGIAVRSMGPAAALPVMRGLTGDRILVLHDGQRSGDLAGSADDHGMTIDPLSAQRVEVVRGPATLLYGNNALGGVVNVITSDIPGSLPRRPEYAFAVQAETAYPGASASGRVTVPLGSGWAFGARAGGRRAGDMRIPRDPVLGRRLDNTARQDRSGAAGVGLMGSRGSGGVVVRGYDFRYGLPAPQGADPVRLEGRRLEGSARAELALASRLLPSLRLEASWQDYRHDELDAGTSHSLQAFALETRTFGMLLRQGAVGPVSAGAWGVSGLFRGYAARGPEALTPPADSRGLGIFGFQEIGLGPASLEVGGRLDDYRITTRATAKFGAAQERNFRAGSGSVGLRVPLGGAFTAAGSLTRSFRAPTVEELFSAAAHAGTGSVEFGNPGLQAERGDTREVMLRVQDSRWHGQLAVYHSAIRDYVHLVARGDTVLEGITLPVLEYDRTPAVLQGVEGSIEWAATPLLVLSVLGDYIHAAQGNRTPISFMPPARLGAGARREGDRISVGADVDHRFRQSRIGPADEDATPGHTLLRLHGAIRFGTAGRAHSVAVRVENATNVLHREATSRIKDFAPAAGRSVALLYRVHW